MPFPPVPVAVELLFPPVAEAFPPAPPVALLVELDELLMFTLLETVMVLWPLTEPLLELLADPEANALETD